MSILATGLRSATGAFSWNTPVAYLSPSILYASHPRYAKIHETPDGQYFQTVLHVRVDPTRVHHEGGPTIGDRDAFSDPHLGTSYQNVEWLVKPKDVRIRGDQQDARFQRGVQNVQINGGIVVYGILMRSWSPTNPPEDVLSEMQWWGNNWKRYVVKLEQE